MSTTALDIRTSLDTIEQMYYAELERVLPHGAVPVTYGALMTSMYASVDMTKSHITLAERMSTVSDLQVAYRPLWYVMPDDYEAVRGCYPEGDGYKHTRITLAYETNFGKFYLLVTEQRV